MTELSCKGLIKSINFVIVYDFHNNDHKNKSLFLQDKRKIVLIINDGWSTFKSERYFYSKLYNIYGGFSCLGLEIRVEHKC